MTDSDEWKKVPGVSYYEWSHRGKVRSLPRTKNGRAYPGADPMKLREDGDGYLVVNFTDDSGQRHHGMSVARMILLAHDPGGHTPGLEACHGRGGRKDNRFPENLRWDTEEANRMEALDARRANGPPKPAKTCPRCGRSHRGRGQNCHECVVALGVACAQKVAAGVPPDTIAADLEYPFAAAFNLAVKYGGLRVYLDHAPSPQPKQPWLRRVINGARGSRQNSDAR